MKVFGLAAILRFAVRAGWSLRTVRYRPEEILGVGLTLPGAHPRGQWLGRFLGVERQVLVAYGVKRWLKVTPHGRAGRTTDDLAVRIL